jgi:hypothetical protein
LLLLMMLMVFVQLHEHEHEHELLLVVAPCGAATGDWICYNKLNGFLQVQFARIF